jgi:hypothetical protein
MKSGVWSPSNKKRVSLTRKQWAELKNEILKGDLRLRILLIEFSLRVLKWISARWIPYLLTKREITCYTNLQTIVETVP